MGAGWIWRELVWVAMLTLIALIITAGLAPAVGTLERHGWPRSPAEWTLVVAIVGSLVFFLALTWSSLTSQGEHLGAQVVAFEHEIEQTASTYTPSAHAGVRASMRRSDMGGTLPS